MVSSDNQDSHNSDEEFAAKLSRAAERLVSKLRVTETEVSGEPHSIFPTSATPELTALHKAIGEKSLKKVNAVIRKGVDVNQCHTNSDWGFPVIHAFEVGDKRVLRAVLKAGGNPNVTDLLAICVQKNDLSLAKLLIEYGADAKGQPTWEKDDEFETNLIRATRLGRYPFVKLLLEEGADPNVHNADNESALLVAMKNNNKTIANLLRKHVSAEELAWVEERCSGAYEDKLKLDQEIYHAIYAGETEKVLSLLEESERPLDALLEPERGSPLEESLNAYFAALSATSPQKSTTNLKEWRANYKPDYNDPDVRAKRRTIYALLDLNAPVDLIGWRAPLAYLERLGDALEDVELGMKLIENASDINSPITYEKDTALMMVVTLGRLGYSKVFVKALLARGADPNAKNCYGQSVIQRARECEQWEGPNPCIPLLLEAGAME